MRAVIYDPEAAGKLSFSEVAEPVPAPHQAMIDVAAISLNFGEIAWLGETRSAGQIPGWDTAGVVRVPAADGTGPGPGARVVGFGAGGGWAQYRAMDTGDLAVVPDGIALDTAAALPIAGVTAVQAVRALGPVLGRRILITGASGGVGRFAVQLAARGRSSRGCGRQHCAGARTHRAGCRRGRGGAR